jgi:hypothetical protein
LQDASQFLHSSLREKILEHQFVGELLSCLWRLGRRDIELLRAEVDAAGYDLVLECNKCVRHIQLKASHHTSVVRSINAHVGLTTVPSACIIWVIFDASTMKLGPFLWFGSQPGHSIASLGDQVAKHKKADAGGRKSLRPSIRVIKKANFRALATIEEVAEALFGVQAAAPPFRVEL